jgi:hypothetical protein
MEIIINANLKSNLNIFLMTKKASNININDQLTN